MATVTGFTAERMLEIENTTVVDGTVTGDNLILMTREGTPIDAGNVRGPQGIQGPVGPVESINDQAGATYAPRIFASKTLLDASWAGAPRGAIAVTTDNESIWEKNNTAWNIENGVRIFTNIAERNARWASPPSGAFAVTLDTNQLWQYTTTYGWTKPWGMPWGLISYAEWVGGSGDIGASPAFTGLFIQFTAVAQRKLLLTGHMTFLHKDTNGHCNLILRRDSTSVSQTNFTLGVNCYGTLHVRSIVTTNAGVHTYGLHASCDTGALNIIGGSTSFVNVLSAEDLGPA
jgi:hypothetical protein